MFPQEYWGTICALEEQVRAEEWNTLRQEIADGTAVPPPGYDPSSPWATIIPASRPFYTMGLLQDWWQERLYVLERAPSGKGLSSSSASSSSGTPILPGVLPAFLGQAVIPELAGKNALQDRATPPPPNPHPQKSKKQRQRERVAAANKANNNPRNNPGNKRKSDVVVGPCWHCGKMGHEQKDCWSKGKGKGKGGKGKGGKGKAAETPSN